MSSKQRTLVQTDTLPGWLEGYDRPVVRTQGRGHNSTMHRPDPSADEPEPACSQANAGNSFVVAERSHLESHYDNCQNEDCYGGDQ